MSTVTVSVFILALLIGAIWAGRRVSKSLPERFFGAATHDTVKLSLGLVATMTAVLLGFLVSSAKASYDDQKHQVLEMAARVSVLDRLLALYGDGAVGARRDLRVAVRVSVARAWPQHGRSDLGTLALSGGMLETIEQLAPQSALQTEIRGQAVSLELDIAERRSLLVAQAQGASIPPLVVVVLWLIAILFGFSLIAPRSPVALLALLVAAASASGAIYLVLELHHPFDGLLRISSAPLTEALGLPPN